MKSGKANKKLPKGFSKSKSLDKYADKVLFKDKVDMANKILETVGVPEIHTSEPLAGNKTNNLKD